MSSNTKKGAFKIAKNFSKKKKDIVKAAAVAAVVLPLQFFVPGAKPIVSKAKGIIKYIINVYKNKDALMNLFAELKINDASLLQIIELLVKENYTFLENNCEKNDFGIKNIKFESKDISIDLHISEIYKEFETLKKTNSLFNTYGKINLEHSQLSSFPIAIIILLDKLSNLQNHVSLELPDYKGNDLTINQYIDMVNLMQSNILQKHSPVFREIIENTNKMLFPQRYMDDIEEKEKDTIAETKLGGGLKFTFNHLSLLRDVYNFNSPSFTKNVYAMMYSKDVIAKGMINDYMDYLLFTSISDADMDFFNDIYKKLENNIIMLESCEQLLNVKKQKTSSITSKNNTGLHLYTNKLSIELNNGKIFTIAKHGTLNFALSYIVLSCIQKLKKYYVAELKNEILGMKNRIHFSDLRQDDIQDFVDNYLSKLVTDPKYSIFLELLIFNNAYSYNVMHKALLNYYCPI